MKTKERLHQIRQQIEEIAHRHGVIAIRLFGSVARDEETDESDVDFLVTTGERTSPWFPGGLIVELEKVIGRKVDIVTEKGINPSIRESVMKEAILL